MKHVLTAAALAAVLCGGMRTHAQVSAAPTLINFQGRLTTPTGVPVPDGTYSIRFSLWDAVTAGTEKWNQTIAGVQVKNGTFAVLLNTSTANLFNDNLFLEIKVGTDAAQTPRQQIVSVPYALKANTVPDGSITTAKIADGTITTAKLAPGASSPTGTAGGDLDGIYPNPNLATLASSLFKVSGGVLYSSGGKIGIGIINPAQLFHVFTSVANDSGGFIKYENGNSGTGAATNAQLLGLNRFGSLQNMVWEDYGGRIGMRTTTNGGMGNLYFTSGNDQVFMAGLSNGRVGIGTTTPTTLLDVRGEITANIVTVTGGSDVAEPYHVAKSKQTLPLPGMVVCIDSVNIGRMKISAKPYDRTVAGIISGANGIKPGITLRQKGTVADGTLPVASIGRVWCWCDADANGAIAAGDMLTTSKTLGHAMKVTRFGAANGAVIGKAMSSLKRGKGLVLVLVSLK